MGRSRPVAPSMADSQLDEVWQDREIKFDQQPSVLRLRRGEFQVDSINSVEDTKGNNGERGILIVTNLGTFIITNVRTVWFAVLAENFNVSIPYLQMKSINVRNSKFGQALVIETTASSGGYILGFRADPVDHLEQVYTQILNLWKIFSSTPIFGVEYTVEDKPEDGKDNFVPRTEDDVEIVEGDDIEPCLLYQPDGEKEIDREPVYCQELGLAIERLKEGTTLQSLWAVL